MDNDKVYESYEDVPEEVRAKIRASVTCTVHDFEPDGRCICGEHIALVPHLARLIPCERGLCKYPQENA